MLRIWTPDVVTELVAESADALLDELRKVARSERDFDAVAAVKTLERHRGRQEPAEPSRGEFTATLRALDHLRNLGRVGDLILLRDRLYAWLGWAPITYELLLFDARHIEPFTSYSGPYIAGDRLVTAKREEWRVVRIEDDRDPVRLLCDVWTNDD